MGEKRRRGGVQGLEPLDRDSGELNVVIDTPQGSRNKFKYDKDLGLFRLTKVLPAGAVFPFDFGFVPGTRAGDGDPLDVLVLMDAAAFVGCVVPSRLLGVIEARQTEGQRTERNDRLIAVTTESRNHRGLRSLEDLSENLVAEIEHFFVSYNAMEGRRFEPAGRHGPPRARRLLRAATEGRRARGRSR